MVVTVFARFAGTNSKFAMFMSNEVLVNLRESGNFK